jgi:cardiolipin synthase
MSHDANLRRLSDIAARGWNEGVAMVDGRMADVRDDEFMVIRFIDGCRGDCRKVPAQVYGM